MGLGAWGLGFGVWGLEFRVWGLGFGVWGLVTCRSATQLVDEQGALEIGFRV